MNIIIQLVCIIISFIYGIFIYFFVKLNKKLIYKNNILFQIIYRLVTTFLLVLLYIIIIYKINKGIFHVYFIILIIIGYLFITNNIKKLK